MTGAEQHENEKGLLKHIQNMCRNSRRRNNNPKTILRKIENMIQNMFKEDKKYHGKGKSIAQNTIMNDKKKCNKGVIHIDVKELINEVNEPKKVNKQVQPIPCNIPCKREKLIIEAKGFETKEWKVLVMLYHEWLKVLNNKDGSRLRKLSLDIISAAQVIKKEMINERERKYENTNDEMQTLKIQERKENVLKEVLQDVVESIK